MLSLGSVYLQIWTKKPAYANETILSKTSLGQNRLKLCMPLSIGRGEWRTQILTHKLNTSAYHPLTHYLFASLPTLLRPHSKLYPTYTLDASQPQPLMRGRAFNTWGYKLVEKPQPSFRAHCSLVRYTTVNTCIMCTHYSTSFNTVCGETGSQIQHRHRPQIRILYNPYLEQWTYLQ